MKRAPTALYWCGNVVIDRQFDQLGKVLVCVSAVTIRHRGRATRRFIPASSVPKTQKKRSCTAIVTEIALSLDGMKCDAAMRGVVLAVLLIGHAAAGSREQVQSAL